MGKVKSSVFINYRRADSAGYAGRIYDRLAAHFGEDAIFMDVHTVEAGLDFVDVLENAVQSCDVLVVLIGKQWLNIKDPDGNRRLDNPRDFVRIEVAAALSHGIRVIPVLVDGTPMPNSDQLPNNLESLTRRNAVLVSHYSFHNDTNRLIEQLELALKAAEESKILRAKDLKEKNAQKKRQAEIENLLSQADNALELQGWELAKEKFEAILILEPEHVQAQIKLEIVKRKLRKINNLVLAEKKAKQKAAEKAVREKAEREAAEKAMREMAEREMRQATVKAAKEKAKREAPAMKVAPRSLPWSSGFSIVVSGVQTLLEKFKKTDQPEKSVKVDEVSFTARYPKEGNVEKWYTLLVYAHIDTMIKEVRKDAMRFEDQMGEPRESTSRASTKLVRGTEITIVPKCEGITFNPKQTKIKWMENIHRANFRFRADKTLEGDAAKGHINIFVGPVIIGSLIFSMLINDKEIPKEHEQEEHCSMYRKDKIFISYSHKDTDIALAFKRVHKATGYDVLIDIDSLRSGQEWNSELMRMIDNADIFQLFWSKNSKKSKYCKQKWQHALKRDEEGFIRPLYWQKPLPNPPSELSKYHFEYVEL
jgi:hypothetical protein